MKILYFDCFAGIAGDMTVGALLGAGVPLEHLKSELAKLPLPNGSFSVSAPLTSRKGLSAVNFSVESPHHQPHRHYGDIVSLIDGSTLSAEVKEKARSIFHKLAQAEAKVHGVELERVHFHEVGAIDSIVDIVGTAICLEYLSIDRVVSSPLPVTTGFVTTAHGRLPVPAPATLELLQGVPVHGKAIEGERVTPTGAAIISAVADDFGPLPAMRLQSVGYGAGDRDFADIPNVLRVMLGVRETTLLQDEVMLLETHIDDMNPEILGYVMERLFSEGAYDVAFSPLYMKKNPPATRLTVISPIDKLHHLARIVLYESSAIGLRYYPAGRFKLDRIGETRASSYGPVQVKVLREDGRVVRVAPEYDECQRIARERKIPLLEVYRLLEKEIEE